MVLSTLTVDNITYDIWAKRTEGTLTIGKFAFNGSEDIEIPVYDGSANQEIIIKENNS